MMLICEYFVLAFVMAVEYERFTCGYCSTVFIFFEIKRVASGVKYKCRTSYHVRANLISSMGFEISL